MPACQNVNCRLKTLHPTGAFYTHETRHRHMRRDNTVLPCFCPCVLGIMVIYSWEFIAWEAKVFSSHFAEEIGPLCVCVCVRGEREREREGEGTHGNCNSRHLRVQPQQRFLTEGKCSSSASPACEWNRPRQNNAGLTLSSVTNIWLSGEGSFSSSPRCKASVTDNFPELPQRLAQVTSVSNFTASLVLTRSECVLSSGVALRDTRRSCFDVAELLCAYVATIWRIRSLRCFFKRWGVWMLEW